MTAPNITSYLIYAIIALQVADFMTTARMLQGGGTELNPVTAKIYGTLGIIPGLILVKGSIIGFFL